MLACVTLAVIGKKILETSMGFGGWRLDIYGLWRLVDRCSIQFDNSVLPCKKKNMRLNKTRSLKAGPEMTRSIMCASMIFGGSMLTDVSCRAYSPSVKPMIELLVRDF
jgi:hypothetical protein